MEQVKTEKKLQEVQEAELKEEKFKKIFILLIVSLLFGGTCYYYAGINNSSQKELTQNKITKTKLTKTALLNKEKKVAQLELEKIQKTEKNLEIATEKIVPKTKFKPTDKSTLLSLSGKASGKHDPFSYSESRFVPFTTNQSENPSSYPGNLPPLPGAGDTGNLPTLPGFSPLSPSGLANPPAPKPEDLIIVKGFIGNKVIAEIDGVVEALNKNEKISNIKVLSVDPSILTAKFEINGKPVTKTIKSLIDENNENIHLVKNLHN